MDAPKSKRFRELRRQNGAVTSEAVKQSLKGRRKGWLQRVFRFGGKTYEVTAVRSEEVAPVTIPSENK